MKKIFIIFTPLITICSMNVYANYEPNYFEGNELYDIEYQNKVETLFPDLLIGDPLSKFHLYGYISSTYSYHDNPYYYSEDTLSILNQEKKDNSSTNKLYLVNAIELSDHMVWESKFIGTGRFYENYHELDDLYFQIKTGPSFLLRNHNTRISTKLIYGDSEEAYSNEFRSIGAAVKVNHSFFGKLNSTFGGEIVKRNYNESHTDETDRYVYSVFLKNKFSLSHSHMFKFTPLYKHYETEQDYQDKDVYGLSLGYTYFPEQTDLYMGAGYDYLNVLFMAPEPGELDNNRIIENEYSVYFGYKLFKTFSAQLTYSNKKVTVSQLSSDISTVYDNTVSLTLMYRFHLL